jgi:hypothetical protein
LSEVRHEARSKEVMLPAKSTSEAGRTGNRIIAAFPPASNGGSETALNH